MENDGKVQRHKDGPEKDEDGIEMPEVKLSNEEVIDDDDETLESLNEESSVTMADLMKMLDDELMKEDLKIAHKGAFETAKRLGKEALKDYYGEDEIEAPIVDRKEFERERNLTPEEIARKERKARLSAAQAIHDARHEKAKAMADKGFDFDQMMAERNSKMDEYRKIWQERAEKFERDYKRAMKETEAITIQTLKSVHDHARMVYRSKGSDDFITIGGENNINFLGLSDAKVGDRFGLELSQSYDNAGVPTLKFKLIKIEGVKNEQEK